MDLKVWCCFGWMWGVFFFSLIRFSTEFAEEIYGEAREYLEEERAMEEAIALHGVRFVGFGLANYDSELDESFSGSDVSDGQDEEMVLSSSESSFSSSSSSSFEFPESSVSGTPFNAIGHDVSFRPDSSSSSSSESEASVGTKRVQRHVARYPLRTRSASAAAPRAASPPRRAASPPRRRAASPPRRRASSPPRTRRSRSGVENGNVNTRPSTRAKRINLVEDEEDDDLFDDEFELPKRKKEINLVDDDDDDDDEEVRPKRKASRRGRSTAKQSESDSIFSPS
jgi:hypothetical protein